MNEVILEDCINIESITVNKKVDLIYVDPPFNTGRDFGEYNDSWSTMDDYLNWLKPRLESCWKAIDTGNIIIHLDWRAVHYVKCIMDAIATPDNFRNEIIWSYSSGGASKRQLSRKHDNLLWYSKGPDYTFNIQREPYATPNVETRQGFNPDGRMLTDVWNIPFISTTSHERSGYPTQKPLKLLERIVTIFSNPKDLVVDAFCGSGTTGVAAKKLDRSYLLLDINQSAVDIAKDRISKV